MKFKRNIILITVLFYFQITFAQQAWKKNEIKPKEGYAIVEEKANIYPKFYKLLYNLKKNESKLKAYVFVRGHGNGSPAAASRTGTIIIDISFIESNIPNYDDNRLIVVLYHELGHLYFFSEHDNSNISSEDNEKYAFEYSLKRTKGLAEEGDCLPLKTGLKFMKLRSESDNLQDDHVRALKRMVNEQLFKDYSKYAESCGKNISNLPDKFAELRVEIDKGDSIFYDKNSPLIREQKSIYLYIVKHNSEAPKLKMCIQFSGLNPIYVTDYLINNSYKINIDASKLVRTQNESYNSWYDIPLDAKLLNIMNAIVKSENPTIKYIGTAGIVDFTITEKEKTAIINILMKYLTMTY